MHLRERRRRKTTSSPQAKAPNFYREGAKEGERKSIAKTRGPEKEDNFPTLKDPRESPKSLP